MLGWDPNLSMGGSDANQTAPVPVRGSLLVLMTTFLLALLRGV